MRESGLLARLATWWRLPDRYDWLIAHVDAGGYGWLTRLGIAAGGAAIGAWPILMALSPQGVTDPASRIITVICGVIALVFACVWVFGWPSYQQSKVIVVVLNASIALSSVLYVLEDKPVTSTLAFALTASYVACAHTLPSLTVVLALATVPIVMRIVIVGMDGDLAGGLADGALRLASVIVVPMTIRTLVQLLSDSAVVSDIDPLTELANRRGLVRAVRGLLGTAGAQRICMTMIDIDDFKTINDTRGHATGDHVLISLGRVLRRICPPDAAIARIGGEEFAVVALCDSDAATRVAERLRAEFAASGTDFTASFGIATGPLAHNGADDAIGLTDRLLAASDRAMYVAKRAGGDRVEVVTLGS